ncbi:gamma-secretase subunit PEN-2-like [Clavelina lepadiformis]|uniref:Gamma-secretase subunit PEN-2 n=1 Tax=Clavelina lepadiformis TaxID=159417 RepID=A0ABP0GR89_CLALP
MNLEKMQNAEKLKLCRRYYFGGFLALPFLWAVNAVWFVREAFFKPHFEEQAEMRKYVIRSTIGAVVWVAGIIAWNVIFQLNRASWGEVADRISYVIPTGIP